MTTINERTGIWDLEAAKKWHFHDPALAREIIAVYSPAPFRAADLGCGLGEYVKAFREAGWPLVDGFEGTPGISAVAVAEGIYGIDLSRAQYPVRGNYNFVLSLEVGEHIPVCCEQVFMNNLDIFCAKDLLLSWAIPGQCGIGHVNEKPNAYIIDEMRVRGFQFVAEISTRLREASTLPWFKNTLMAFTRS